MKRQEEFERVAMVHARALLRTALRLSGSPEAAEDLTQEALLRAWRGFDQFEAGSNAKAWLFRILLNLASRRWSQLQSAPTLEAIEEGGSEPAVAPDEMTHAHVLAALDTLPPEFRVVLVLAVIEGFSCKEISGLLGIPMGTVMSRLSRARKGLRKRVLEMERKPTEISTKIPTLSPTKNVGDKGGAAATGRATSGGMVQ